MIAFAKRLNAIILEKATKKESKKENPVFWLEKIAKNGGIKSITAPSEWQKEIRTDNILPNREK